MSQIVQWFGPSGIGQTLKLFALDSDTVIESATGTEATNRKGRYSATLATANTGRHEVVVVRTSDGVGLAGGFVALAGEAGSAECYGSEIAAVEEYDGPTKAELDEAIEGIDATAEVTVQMAPWYAQLQNGAYESNFSLKLTEVKRVQVAVLDSSGEPVVLDDLSYDTFQLVIKDEAGNVIQTVEDASITTSSNVFSFVNSTDVTESVRTLPYTLWGNGGEAPSIHTEVVQGRISVQD